MRPGYENMRIELIAIWLDWCRGDRNKTVPGSTQQCVGLDQAVTESQVVIPATAFAAYGGSAAAGGDFADIQVAPRQVHRSD